jgi:hypothetical protein
MQRIGQPRIALFHWALGHRSIRFGAPADSALAAQRKKRHARRA